MMTQRLTHCLRLILLVACLSGLFSTAQAVDAADKAMTASWQRVVLGNEPDRYDFPVYSNHDLKGDLKHIREVIFIIHGVQRNGDHYFAAAQALLEQSGRNPKEVLLIAPNFPSTADIAKGFDNMPVWGVHDWAVGLDAQGVAFALSSFNVLDDLLGMVTKKPRVDGVTTVTVAGHSAGAQLVQRYAALNSVDEKIRAQGLELRYVVANPSSFLYFNGQRPSGRSFKDDDQSLCPGYNQYRYGMQDMIPYARGVTGAALFKRYSYRSVTYLMGTRDNDPEHRLLDKTCAAQAQGGNRLERSRAYVRYERFLAGRATKIHHLAYEVVDVGHNQEKMFGSVCGLMTLFQIEPPKDFKGAACRPYLF